MGRLLILLLIVAAAAGAYFTRPDEPKMRAAADAVLNDPNNLEQLGQSVGAAFAGERAYNNYYVVAKYSVALGDRALVTCWGAFTQIQCDRPSANSGG